MIKKSIIGFISGFITGLFSAGGGTILVPSFVHFLGLNEKEARATSICCVLPATLISFVFYAKDKLIDVNLSIKCAIGGMIGAYVGTKLLKKLPDSILKLCFTIFLLFISIKLITD